MLDRFTLDEVSAKIWWPLAMVALVALVLTVPAANHAADRARRQSAATAILLSTDQIQPLTEAGATSAGISTELARIQQANPQYDAVRVWAGTDHHLIASSVRSDPLYGGTAGTNDSDIDGAMSSGSRLDVTDQLPTGDTGPTTVHTFVKIDSATTPVVTEFQASDAALLAQVHHDWNGYRIVAALAFLLLLVLALASMREPVADIGVGVPFYPASLPPNLAIVDAERAVVIEHEDDHVRQRVESLQTRLDESERQRLKAEARLQQALTTLGTGGRNVPGLPPEPPTPTLPASRTTSGRLAKAEPERPAAAAPIPATAEVPTPPLQPAAAAASAEPASRRGSKKRSSRRSQKPAAERTPAPRRSRADEPSETPSETPAVIPAPTPVAPERVTVKAQDVTVSAQPAADVPPKTADPTESRPEVVVLPSEKPTPVGASKASAAPAPASAVKASAPATAPAPAKASAPATAPAPAHTADPVADDLDRIAHEGEADVEPLDDPADLRARLARTAALKKPGSRERQDQRDALHPRSSEQ